MIVANPTTDLLATTLARVDFFTRLPQQRRLYEAVKTAILGQYLPEGSKLPSSRQLAQDLKISRNTIIAAFKQLVTEGFLTSQTGSGTFVAPNSSFVREAEKSCPSNTLNESTLLSRRGLSLSNYSAGEHFEIQPFAPGDADFSNFPIKIWQRLHNRVWREARVELLDYSTTGGYLPLRQAITDYLRLSRSVKVNVDQILITGGTQHSLDLCAQLLVDSGDTVWVENPCYWGAQCVFLARDLNLHPITLDKEGMSPNTNDLLTSPCLIYLTPSHQYPTGVVMSLPRRHQILEIAAAKKSWIIEDDYDSEFRYSGPPLAALQGLDTHGRVIYMGTFSKVLYPGIKLGYLVVPEQLSRAFKTALYDLQRPGNQILQAALTDFISQGYFNTHVRKIRQAYGERRELLHKTLSLFLKNKIRVSGEESGLHLVIELPDYVDDTSLVARAHEAGLMIKALSSYYLAPPIRRGLLVGYAYVPLNKISYYGKLLARIILTGEGG